MATIQEPPPAVSIARRNGGVGPLRTAARIVIEKIEGAFDAVFAPGWNPWYQLGALGWFYYWVVLVSGIYLFIFFDTGVIQAYESVEQITHAQWYAGGVMRSLHRYASDALVVMALLHLVREFILGRLYGARWFAWSTGVMMMWFVYASGVSGYWLVWDKLAQYVAIAASEWLDALSFFGEPIARNFQTERTLNARFFTLLLFIHIAVPLFLLFFMWVHIQRYLRPRVNPPRGLAIGTLLMLLALSLAKPALSQGPAVLDQVPSQVGLDWFYLTLFPLLEYVSAETLWLVVIGATAFLFMLPWLRRRLPLPVAAVHLDNCNGCGRCVADCPFSALALVPRSDGLPFAAEVTVTAARCVSCGICAGACPTATPFRRKSDLIPGIELPSAPITALREQTMAAAGRLRGEARVIVYACDLGFDWSLLEGEGIAVVGVPCVGMLPPAFVDFVLSRRLADGVLFTGCRDGDCYHRLGMRWTEQRLRRERDPQLRQRVPAERVATFWGGVARIDELRQVLRAFRDRLRRLPAVKRRPLAAGGEPVPEVEAVHE